MNNKVVYAWIADGIPFYIGIGNPKRAYTYKGRTSYSTNKRLKAERENCFEVRKENKKVNQFHQMFGSIKISEDDLNYYYILSKETFKNNTTYNFDSFSNSSYTSRRIVLFDSFNIKTS